MRSKFDFEAVHRADVNLQAADALSCLPMTVRDSSPLEDTVPIFTIIKEQQEEKTPKGGKHLA